MRIVVVSDLHGDLEAAERARARFRPDLLLSCGDWGDPEQVDEADLQAIVDVVPLYTTFGNHDPLELLARLHNSDGSPILVPSGTVQQFGGLKVAAVGGIWARSHAKIHYVTDADVAGFAARIAESGPVDILVTHGCPIGMADVIATGRHGGQLCFLEAFRTIAPRLYLCGHLHVAQEYTLKDGRQVMNVGATPEGTLIIVDFDAGTRSMQARLERLPAR